MDERNLYPTLKEPLADPEMGRKIACVTGASGKIGRRIVELLLKNGYHVRIMIRDQHSSDTGVEVKSLLP